MTIMGLVYYFYLIPFMVVIPLIGSEYFFTDIVEVNHLFCWVGLLMLSIIHIYHILDPGYIHPDASNVTLSDMLWWLVTLNYGLIYVLCLHIWVNVATSKLMNWKPFKGKNNE